ncbi:pentapeptide repeat-containing protein [Lysobacter sp. CA196]|uniref:pentapeptide repeat-containing protein n=1 Tax=Lysobacter sp. CA196 TaxID=3455606 RepID=UPI003F8D5C07
MTRRFTFALLSLVVCGGIASAPAFGDAKAPGTAPPRGRSAVPPKSCPSCSFVGVDWSNQDLTDVNLQGADLTGANLSGANMSGAELSGANLANANLSNAVLNPSANGEADLSSANLSGAVFTGAQMLGTDLEYTDLSGANFTATDLSRARLGPAPRTGLYVGRKTSFREAQLPAGVRLDAGTSDSAGSRFTEASASSSKANAFEVDCGSSDLSGLSSAVYVAPDGQDTDACGDTHDSACATITQGLSQCEANGCGVLVDYGVYVQPTPLMLSEGMNLFGGCVPKGHNSNGLRSLIHAPAGGTLAVDAIYIHSPARIENFKVYASPATDASAPSVAFRVRHSKGLLTLVDSQIYAATGAPGQGGADGTSISWSRPDVRCSGSRGVASADTVGSFNGGIWVAGEAGGNGGAGGSNAKSKDFPCTAATGGGTGGGGGSQGGGSFAVVLVDARLQFNGSRIIGSRGGAGGDGGNGGYTGTNALIAACGGAGGAGGNGGPSISVVLTGGAALLGPEPVLYKGVGGAGGKSGRVCPIGDTGKSGLAADQQTF